MFKSQKQNRASKSGERTDFKFSNFQALQVPKGWDKLIVSVISVDTGKVIFKSGKSPVRNGVCQWKETLSESIWLSRDDSSSSSSKELEDCLFKLVVSMGSARSGILGETTINMARYMGSKAHSPISLPLKKCNHGTTLQVKIHCLPPRTKLVVPRDDGSKNSTQMEDEPNGSNNSFSRTSDSPSSQDLESTSNPEKQESTETSYSVSGSNHSFDSAEGSSEKENFFLEKDTNDEKFNRDGREFEAETGSSSSPHDHHPADDSKLMDSGDDLQNLPAEMERSSSAIIIAKNFGSSKNLLEAAEDTIEELHAESKKWERNARKSILDFAILRKEFSDQCKKQADLEMELSASHSEIQSLKKEVEQLKSTKQKNADDSTNKSSGMIHIQKELEDEIKFQREANANLSLQLKRSQESNVELVSVLQELEETLEQQKIEIVNHSSLSSKCSDLEESIHKKLEENKILLLRLEQMHESERTLRADSQMLERDYQSQLSLKEEEIASLENKLSESLEADLIKNIEFEALREKMQELERDCNELTDENLELLVKLKEPKNIAVTESQDKLEANPMVISLETRVSDLLEEKDQLEEKLKIVENENKINSKGLDNLQNDLSAITSSKHELELHLHEREEENDRLLERVSSLEDELKSSNSESMSLQDEIGRLRIQMESQNLYLNQKIQEMEEENWIIQSSAGNLQKSNEELEKRKTELETELSESKRSLVDFSKRVETLEQNIVFMLEEFNLKEKILTSEMESILRESDREKEKLVSESKISNQTHETLIADHEKVLKSLANYRSNEQKLKTYVNDLELKLTVSEYERQQLLEGTANLKVQLQKFEYLQDEIMGLKAKLNESKLEKDKLEAEKRLISEHCEELKSEKTSKEALYMEEKKSNIEYEERIQKLEEERNECLKRAQDLKKQLNLMEEKQKLDDHNEIASEKDQHFGGRRTSTKSNRLQELQPDHQNSQKCGRRGYKEYNSRDGSPRAVEGNHASKMQVLENELAKALEANNKYKSQLQRFLSEGRNNNHANSARKSMAAAEGEVVPKEKFERTKSSLETELRDLRDRYFHMSLKYAEVEGQREDLVMKLKASKSGRRWFS